MLLALKFFVLTFAMQVLIEVYGVIFDKFARLYLEKYHFFNTLTWYEGLLGVLFGIIGRPFLFVRKFQTPVTFINWIVTIIIFWYS